MKNLLTIVFVLGALSNHSIGSAAEGPCSPLTTDLYSNIPGEWIVPGDYKVWNTGCAHYVFNYINRREDATYHDAGSGNFFNYGFATNTVTELDSDNYNFTVGAQINSWSLVRSGTHALFGAAIETVNTPEGDALTTMVATESQVNSRHSENTAAKIGIDTVLYTARGGDDAGIGSDRYNAKSRAHFISATPPIRGEHYGWEAGIYVSRYGLGSSVERDFKTLVNLEEVPDSVCLMTFIRNNGKTGCLRYNIELDQMEIVGDIHNNSDIKVFQTFAE